jgi:hypothetical protein
MLIYIAYMKKSTFLKIILNFLWNSPKMELI